MQLILKRKYILIFIVIVSGLASSFLTSRNGASRQSIAILASSIPKSLDATQTISYNDIQIIDNLFYKLFRRNSSLDFVGDLAESWTINEAEQLLIIKLNSKKQFSDGTAVTADSVAKSISRALHTNSIANFFFRNIISVELIDNNTISIKYKGWEGLVFQQLTSSFMAIYKDGEPPHSDARETWLVRSPLRIVHWDNSRLEIEIIGSKKAITVLANSEPGQILPFIDVALARENTSNQDEIIKSLANDNGQFNVYEFDSFNTKLIFINSRVPKSTRKCIQTAIGKSSIKEQLFANHKNDSILPPGILGKHDWNEDNHHLVTKSLKSFKILVRNGNKNEHTIINKLLPALNECSVSVELELVTDDSYYKRLLGRDFDLATGTISVLYNDPQFVLSFFHPESRFNLTNSTSKIRSAIDAVGSATTKLEVSTLAAKAQYEILNEGLAVPLANLPTTSYVRKPLKLKTHIVFDIINWEDLYVD